MKLDAENVVYTIAEVLIGFTAVVGNSLVCYVIFANHNFRNSPMFLLVASLAISDILVGAFTVPLAVLTKVGHLHTKPYFCLAMLTCLLIPELASINNLTAVSIERYFAIRHSIFHLNRFNRKTSLIMISVAWLFAFCFGSLPLLGWNIIDWSQWSNDDIKQYSTTHNYTINQSAIIECLFEQVIHPDFTVFHSMISGIIPLVICIPLYLLIYLHVKKSKKVLASTCIKFTTSNSTAQTTEVNIQFTSKSVETNKFEKTKRTTKDSSFENIKNSSKFTQTNVHSDDYQKQKSRIQRKREIHIAVVLGLTVLAFAICWLPLHIINLISRYSSYPGNTPIWVKSVAILLTHANSAINIFLYSWRIEAFYKDLNQKVLKRLRKTFRSK